MNIPSFKLRKDLSVKEKHYVLYGLLMREETKMIDDSIIAKIPTMELVDTSYKEIINIPDPKGDEILDILKRYSLKHLLNSKCEIVIKDYKERFVKKYSNNYKAPKYMTKRIHILGLLLLFIDNINFNNGYYEVSLGSFLPTDSIIDIICRLQDFNILTILSKDNNIVFDKDAIQAIIEYEKYYDVLIFRDLINKKS